MFTSGQRLVFGDVCGAQLIIVWQRMASFSIIHVPGWLYLPAASQLLQRQEEATDHRIGRPLPCCHVSLRVAARSASVLLWLAVVEYNVQRGGCEGVSVNAVLSHPSSAPPLPPSHPLCFALQMTQTQASRVRPGERDQWLPAGYTQVTAAARSSAPRHPLCATTLLQTHMHVRVDSPFVYLLLFQLSMSVFSQN